VRDAVAYLRVINNPDDSVSLRRIINEPKRGIGDTTMDTAAALAEAQGISLYRVLEEVENYAALSRAASRIREFISMMESLRDRTEEGDIALHLLYQEMLQKTGYRAMWELAGEAEVGRVENLKELESSILEYEKTNEENASLSGFLEEAALMTDVDNYDANADTVVMMTMHAAKGLEFPVVFLPGMEDGVFPGNASIFNEEEMEEERRLCYVAITRAEKKLYLTRARSRMLYGSTNHNRESRFIMAIPGHLVEEHEATSTYSRPQSGRTWGTPTVTRTSVTESSSFGTPKSSGYSYSSSYGSYAPKKPTANSGSKENWQVGDTVQHKVFGKGVIEVSSPMGNDTLLTVRFEKVGVKKIMANFAKLERI